ncbi:MAG: hypothetical protein KGL39_53145 [Patescibacteria group bacterium]|nr:hypothetical protein [Patescibacteria group bacterium]
MTRIPKYRAWHKAEKKMCEVEVINLSQGAFLKGVSKGEDTHPIDAATGRPVTDTTILAPSRGRFCPFEDIELLEYTGLSDKNGVEIYEGDVTTVTYPPDPYEKNAKPTTYTGKVVLEPGQFEVHASDESYIDLVGNNEAPGIPAEQTIEVIGNIYSNPELLRKDGA